MSRAKPQADERTEEKEQISKTNHNLKFTNSVGSKSLDSPDNQMPRLNVEDFKEAIQQETNLPRLREMNILLKRQITEVRASMIAALGQTSQQEQEPIKNYYQQRRKNGTFEWHVQYYDKEKGKRVQKYAKDFDPQSVKDSPFVTITYHKDYKR